MVEVTLELIESSKKIFKVQKDLQEAEKIEHNETTIINLKRELRKLLDEDAVIKGS